MMAVPKTPTKPKLTSRVRLCLSIRNGKRGEITAKIPLEFLTKFAGVRIEYFSFKDLADLTCFLVTV